MNYETVDENIFIIRLMAYTTCLLPATPVAFVRETLGPARGPVQDRTIGSPLTQARATQKSLCSYENEWFRWL